MASLPCAIVPDYVTNSSSLKVPNSARVSGAPLEIWPIKKVVYNGAEPAEV